MTATLTELARAVGLSESWTDAAGRPHVVPDAMMRRVLAAMGLPCETAAQLAESRDVVVARRREVALVTAALDQPVELPPESWGSGPARLVLENGQTIGVEATEAGGRLTLPPIGTPGYHRLERDDAAMTVAVAPPSAYGVRDATRGRASGGRIWGLAVQLYSLHGGPVGDFGALAEFAEAAAGRGADAVAISPVHALFAGDPSRYSPYAPSSRHFLNVLYAAPEAALGERFVAAACAGAEAQVAPAVASELIDWQRASAEKLALFTRLYDAFRTGGTAGAQADFEDFRRAGGQALEQHALYEALDVHFRAAGAPGDWQAWPAQFHDPSSDAVAAFATDNATAVEFHLFLQWLADRSLGDAQKRARGAGMALGLIADLAIGLHGGGSHAWSRRDELLVGLSVGAPPDPLNLRGQNWGLTAFSPQALAAGGYAPFLATLRAALRHAGGIRIDHVLGLNRLWLVPDGAAPTEGAYLSYPQRDLLRLLALESHRHQAIVIGEDLGTVPEGFRQRIEDAGVMGMNVLWFTRERNGAFLSPERWEASRVALTTTHDLPTIAGWWLGRDIDWAEQCHTMAGPEEVAQARLARRADRRKLWSACTAAGTADGKLPPPKQPGPMVDAAIGFIGRTGADLVVVPIEDVLGLVEQPNVPGTIDEHPNWRRRLAADGETLLAGAEAASRLDLLRRGRAGS